jgi:hypothetical protein
VIEIIQFLLEAEKLQSLNIGKISGGKLPNVMIHHYSKIAHILAVAVNVFAGARPIHAAD